MRSPRQTTERPAGFVGARAISLLDNACLRATVSAELLTTRFAKISAAVRATLLTRTASLDALLPAA